MTAPPPPPAGWYPDPSGSGGQRYFDGTNWGPPSPPPAAVASGSERRFTIHYGFALLAIFSMIGTLLFGIPMIGAEDGSGVAGGMGVLWMMWGGMWTLIWTAFAVQHTLRSRRQ